MLKVILHVVFTIAAVAGEGQPQENDQNQVLFSPPPPLQAYRQAQAFSPAVAARPFQLPHARPCRRRGDLPNSGWVQVPLPYNQPRAYQRDSQIENQAIPSQLKPQSLTENRAPVFDENNDEEQTGQFPSDLGILPDEIIEIDEQVPVQLPLNRNADDKENLRSGQNPVNGNNFVVRSDPNQNYVAYFQPNIDFQDTNNNRINALESSPDCDKLGEQGPGLRSDHSENNAEAIGRNAGDQVQEQALKLLAKCVQEARNSEEHFEGDSRRAMPGNFTSSSKANKAEALPSAPVDLKTESNDDRVAPHLQNPAKNAVTWGSDSRISLLQHGRVCYACSSYFDPSCPRPNATTTIKYCNNEHNACIIKTFQVGGNSILIRDCGHTCNNEDPYNVNPKIKSCSICHTDMCNSSHTIHGFGALIGLIAAALKYL